MAAPKLEINSPDVPVDPSPTGNARALLVDEEGETVELVRGPTESERAAMLMPTSGALPPSPLLPGKIWMMTPENHLAIYYPSSGWLPIWPPTDNAAVEAGNAMLGIDGLWVASDGD